MGGLEPCKVCDSCRIRQSAMKKWLSKNRKK